jgi:hypothetical protein
MLALLSTINFFPMHGHVDRGGDTDPNPIPARFDDGHDDALPDNDPFPFLAA